MCSVVSVYLIRKYVIPYQHCQDSGHQPMSSSTFVSRQTPGPSVRGMVLAFVCWLQCCSAAVLQPDILPHAGTCCLLPARSRHDAVSPVSNISRHQPIIVVTVLLGDNHHHCREQEELRIVAGAPDPAPPCRGHRCWLLYLELFILIWLGVIIEPCSAPTHHSPSCYTQPHSGSQIVF